MKTHLTSLLLAFAIVSTFGRAKEPDVVFADFEKADYGDWNTTGTAFGKGPARGTLPGQMPVIGYSGMGLVNSFLGRDGAVGKLTSPKIKGYALGDNHLDTFRVEDGILKVSYDKYKQFDTKFGHLFYKDKFSHYILRVEYRFVGEQSKGGPSWAIRNSGVMFHCQSPQSMGKDQEFPVSIEAQFLGGLGKGERPTNNVCTPGTNIVMDGKLITRHCTNSKSKTFNGDQWVTAEIEVHGSGKVIHRINGEVVLQYEQCQLDPKDKDATKLIKGDKLLIEEGYIALQAESHPLEFRKVEIRLLDK